MHQVSQILTQPWCSAVLCCDCFVKPSCPVAQPALTTKQLMQYILEERVVYLYLLSSVHPSNSVVKHICTGEAALP